MLHLREMGEYFAQKAVLIYIDMSKLVKKFGQFSQWTGEKLGSSQKTDTSEEFKRLQGDTESRKECIDLIMTPMEALYKTVSKMKDSIDDKEKKLILQVLSQAMSHYGAVLPTDSQYGIVLNKVAETQNDIALEQSKFSKGMIEGYMRILNESLEDHKEYAKLETKLENRRLDFDAKLNKVNKSKKENTILEEETRAAQAKYEETLEVITKKMLELNSQDDEHLKSLIGFVNIQYDYFSSAALHLKELKDKLSTGLLIAPVRTSMLNNTRSLSGKISNDGSLRKSKSNLSLSNADKEYAAVPTPYLNSENQAALSKSNTNPPARPMSVASGSQKQVKVLFEFDAENANELSICPGDIIDVTQEIDEGWWVGKIQGTSRTGMFPSNYTEVLKTEVLPARPRGPSTSERNRSSSYQPPQPVAAALLPPATIRQRSISSDNRANSNPSINNSVPPCSQCGCNDFTAHAFKAGQCNNCYHIH